MREAGTGCSSEAAAAAAAATEASCSSKWTRESPDEDVARDLFVSDVDDDADSEGAIEAAGESVSTPATTSADERADANESGGRLAECVVGRPCVRILNPSVLSPPSAPRLLPLLPLSVCERPRVLLRKPEEKEELPWRELVWGNDDMVKRCPAVAVASDGTRDDAAVDVLWKNLRA